jgi:phosphonate transport system substrate-binding protein
MGFQGKLNMRFRAFIFLGLQALLLTSAQVWGVEAQPIRFGSVAEDIPAVMHQRLTPLTDYLGKAIGRRVVLKVSPDMPRAIEDLSSGNVDLAYLTPVAYLRAEMRR